MKTYVYTHTHTYTHMHRMFVDRNLFLCAVCTYTFIYLFYFCSNILEIFMSM